MEAPAVWEAPAEAVMAAEDKTCRAYKTRTLIWNMQSG